MYCNDIFQFLFWKGSDPGYIEAPVGHDPANDRLSRKTYTRGQQAVVESTNENREHDQYSICKSSTEQLDNFEDVSMEDDERMLEWNEFPPMRAVYCRAKQKYVAKYDHFCAILNTAIGERNHCLFWWFLLSQCCVIWHTLIIAKTGYNWFAPQHSKTDVTAFFVVVILFFILLFMGKHSHVFNYTLAILLLTCLFSCIAIWFELFISWPSCFPHISTNYGSYYI